MKIIAKVVISDYDVCMPIPKKVRANCTYCGQITKRPSYKYCNNKCQADYQYDQYIKRWKSGEISGLIKLGVVSRHVKRFLREKYSDMCCVCRWSEVNIVTGVVPLVADHIDGDWGNNVESNLRLICPNCDSISSTYGALNKNKGRSNRQVSKRIVKARKLLS